MANIKSAKKRMRQAEVRRKQNLARRTALKTAAKKVRSAIETQDVDVARTNLREAEAKFARAKSKGLIHANTAARKISRLAKRVAALEKGNVA